jgi:hypothetical protein
LFFTLCCFRVTKALEKNDTCLKILISKCQYFTEISVQNLLLHTFLCNCISYEQCESWLKPYFYRYGNGPSINLKCLKPNSFLFSSFIIHTREPTLIDQPSIYMRGILLVEIRVKHPYHTDQPKYTLYDSGVFFLAVHLRVN